MSQSSFIDLDQASQRFVDGQLNVDEYLERRTRGWSYRGDTPWKGEDGPPRRDTVESTRSKPQRSRYQKIQEQLLDSLFNGRWEMVDTTGAPSTETTYNCVDLFSGCGGLTLGFEQANFSSLLAVEMDPDAAATYKSAFPEAAVWSGAIEDLDETQIAEVVGDQTVHVLAAGFPCQGFSIAGQRNPKDERNVLFREVIRVAEQLKPLFLVLENVPGIVTMSKGRVFEAIREEFTEIGYPEMSTLVLEAARYGVPQFRPRAIFIANRLGVPNLYPAPVLKDDQLVPIEAAIDDLKTRDRDLAINHDWTHHSEKMVERLAAVPAGGSLYESYRDAWKRQYRGVPSMTIKENHGGVHVHYELDRTLSAREMARLQGFPDSFIFAGRMKRVMFQIGNAVPPPLANHVALAVRSQLDELQAKTTDLNMACWVPVDHDPAPPRVIEFFRDSGAIPMLPALAEVERRYQTKEPKLVAA